MVLTPGSAGSSGDGPGAGGVVVDGQKPARLDSRDGEGFGAGGGEDNRGGYSGAVLLIICHNSFLESVSATFTTDGAGISACASTSDIAAINAGASTTAEDTTFAGNTTTEGAEASSTTSNYTGTASITSSGRQCQMWSSSTPHSHQYTDVGHHNYCRNPNGADGGVWCFTTDPDKEWEYCAVPSCDTGFLHHFKGISKSSYSQDVPWWCQKLVLLVTHLSLNNNVLSFSLNRTVAATVI